MAGDLRSTSDQPHESDVATVHAIYAAMAARDLEQLPLLLDEHVVITQDPALPWGGRFEGHDGFLDFAAALTGTITSQVEIDSIFAADGDVIQVGRTVGTVNATGSAFAIAEVHRWTVVGGKAVRAHFSIDTPAMLLALTPD
ncbi:nuclear transport factor 2 family protein [Dermatobacter hominis]|uniref:nuclear transport factor 2 family protein n=1 Tax=Dermatobacter hominis TaxID=2884263 RepID=UPI001D1094CB|nr:nuclear transport factor 2 family protein [Dermatobacter hominis]UDY37279.1 nuclear transport factor 2 family protein [Dermatobacter hominis]